MRLLNTLLNVSYRLKGTETLKKPSIFQGLGHTTHLFPSLSTMPKGRPLKKPSTNNAWNISEHILAFLFSHHNQDSDGLPPPLYPHNHQAIASNYLVPGFIATSSQHQQTL